MAPYVPPLQAVECEFCAEQDALPLQVAPLLYLPYTQPGAAVIVVASVVVVGAGVVVVVVVVVGVGVVVVVVVVVVVPAGVAIQASFH